MTINAALVDVLIVGGLDYERVAGLSSGERSVLLRPHLETMSERFRLIDENGRELIPDSVEFRIPDYGGGSAVFSPGLDQRQTTILMEYTWPSPPSRMLFWQSFGEGRISDMYPEEQHHARYDHANVAVDAAASIPIYTSLTVRQKGELVLLPSEFGPGFPVLYSFSWDSDPEPLAHRTSLQSAAPDWENRPANARLTVGESEVTWRVHITVEALAEAFTDGFPASEEPRSGLEWEELGDYLSERLIFVVDGEAADPGAVSVKVHPMSAMGLLHQRELPPGTQRAGMVVLEASSTVTEPPREVVAGWTFHADSIGPLYSEVVDSGEAAGFLVLSPENPTLDYRR